MDIPTILYSPDGATSLSDIFYPIIPSFVCPSFKTYCGDDYMTFWTRWVPLNQMSKEFKFCWMAATLYYVFQDKCAQFKWIISFRIHNFVSQIWLDFYSLPVFITNPVDYLRRKYNVNATGISITFPPLNPDETFTCEIMFTLT